MKLKSVYIIFFISFSFSLLAQYEETKIKASLVYYFGQYVTWQNEKDIKEFRLGVLSEDTVFFSELRTVSKIYRLKDRPLHVLSISDNNIPSDLHILYVDNSYSKKIPRIADKVAGKHVLIISYQCQEGLFSMINMYKEKEGKTIAFQVNRQNLDAEGFKYSSELLLQGGTLIDLKELYKSVSTQLESEMQRLKNLQEENKELNRESDTLKYQLGNYSLQIDSMAMLVASKEFNLTKVNNAISEKEKMFWLQEKELAIRQLELSGLEDSIHMKDKLLLAKNEELNWKTDTLEVKQKRIAEKDFELVEKDIQLRSKERNAFILLGVVFIFMLAAYLGFRGYRTNKVLNIKLEKIVDERTQELEIHKNHLEDLVDKRTLEVKQLNVRLSDSNVELSNTNKALIESNIELQKQRTEIQLLNQELLTSNSGLNVSNESLIAKTRELEEALKIINETKSQLIQSEKMASLGFLIAGIAHEINNPVNFISAGVQALQRMEEHLNNIFIEYDKKLIEYAGDSEIQLKENARTVSLKLQRIFNNMLDGVHRISEIVNSLSNYSRNDGDSFAKQNVVDIIKSTLVILHNKYKGRINIVQNYDGVPEIVCVHGRIGQLFMNIISNAIDAIEGKGEIIIRGRKDEDAKQVILSIKDNGVGIPWKDHKRIFDPFFTTKEVGKGTGLGLYIAYGVVEQHGGRIDVVSEPGNGTEFIIQLPINTVTS